MQGDRAQALCPPAYMGEPKLEGGGPPQGGVGEGPPQGGARQAKHGRGERGRQATAGGRVPSMPLYAPTIVGTP